ncbi:DUF2236 domain-containing protein [Taibaiella lutea]|uniref:DUF2236 domain-containing protein n=1 Tax=Taibaiella lutea TaxID=2608001 RepID=A0A5M6CDJ1_9BACT|nr:oxygenase MpaB family protein [Taibaiella lutea]KAA5533244.1 DUF2236 domain-containing protein [Taibaiella lutea]
MKYFVRPDSIVREIWGKADTILFIFAGAAAEFSLNKAVDWLYFTGKLPADPIGRLFSTVGYAKQIIFSEEDKAHAAIDRMRIIHSGVEANRGHVIPDWAYRDVLYMLIHYSITSFELLERKLTQEEKEEILSVFLKVGNRMGIPSLPKTFEEWLDSHEVQLKEDLIKSDFTADLYKQYKKHLGKLRYQVLLKVQSRIAPQKVLDLLALKPSNILPVALCGYKICRRLQLDSMLKSLLLPQKYQPQIAQLNEH